MARTPFVTSPILSYLRAIVKPTGNYKGDKKKAAPHMKFGTAGSARLVSPGEEEQIGD